MKIKRNTLRSCALVFAYLSIMQIHTAYSMHALSDKTFAAYYIGQTLLKNWVYRPIYTYEMPFELPEELPTPQDIANSIAQKIGVHNFMRGASTSAHQFGKLCQPASCSWSRFAEEYNLTQPTDAHYQIDWDKHYKKYIDYAKDELHLNALRFSIEWALVQPDNSDQFNTSMLTHYADIFKYMIIRGITPVICFHHYTDPCWFLDKGGFEDAANIKYFVHFCHKTYEHIMTIAQNDSQVVDTLRTMHPLWATYNAPEGYAFRGYHQKQGPPSIASQSGLKIVAEVLKNMLKAHVTVYGEIKRTYADMKLAHKDIPAPKIGFLKNIHQIDPAHETWIQYAASPITRLLISFADMTQNGAVYSFFTTGTFQVQIPYIGNIKEHDKNAPNSLDFIGLNYYANRHMMLTKSIKPTNKEKCSDNDWYYRYPQGMYRAIIEISENLARPLGIPVFITENGIATRDNAKRAQFYHEYLYAIYKALEDGYPVFGYLPWSLADNYEWPALKDNKRRDYGLCAVMQPDCLVVKEGSKPYLSFTNHLYELEIKI